MSTDPQWPKPVSPWPKDFPPVLVQCSLATLYAGAAKQGERLVGGKSEAYRLAKGGDVDAAADVVEAVIDVERVVHIGEKYGDCIVAAIHAEEEQGRNKLPVAYANAIGDICEFDVDDEIVQVAITPETANQIRTNSPAMLSMIYLDVMASRRPSSTSPNQRGERSSASQPLRPSEVASLRKDKKAANKKLRGRYAHLRTAAAR